MLSWIQSRRDFLCSARHLIAGFGLVALTGSLGGSANAQPLPGPVFNPAPPVVSKWHIYEGKLDDNATPIRITLGMSPDRKPITLWGDIGGGFPPPILIMQPPNGRGFDLVKFPEGRVGGTDWPQVANDGRSLRGSVSLNGKEFRYAAELKQVMDPFRPNPGPGPGPGPGPSPGPMPRPPRIDDMPRPPRIDDMPRPPRIDSIPLPNPPFPPSPVPPTPPSPPLPRP